MLKFLEKREIFGAKQNKGKSKLNYDSYFSRLVCYDEDIFTVSGDYEPVPPFSCKFRRDDQIHDILVVASEEGQLMFLDTSKEGSKTHLHTFKAHDNAIFDVCWLPHKPWIITAAADHQAIVWDTISMQYLNVYKKNNNSLKCVDVCPTQSDVFATGSRDGSISIWDLRVPKIHIDKPEICIIDAHIPTELLLPSKSRRSKSISNNVKPFYSVTSVAFQGCHFLASSGVIDGLLKIWDLRKTYISNYKHSSLHRHQLMTDNNKGIKNGFTHILFDSSYKNLYACSTANKIYKFDCHTYFKYPVALYEGFRAATYFVKIDLSSDGDYLLSGSSYYNNAYIWKTSSPGLPLFKLTGHDAEVTSVAFKPHDNTKVVTCGDDNRIFLWKIKNIENFDHKHIYGRSSLFQGEASSKSAFAVTSSHNESIQLEEKKPKKSLPRGISSFFARFESIPSKRLHTSFDAEIISCVTDSKNDAENTLASNTSESSLDETIISEISNTVSSDILPSSFFSSTLSPKPVIQSNILNKLKRINKTDMNYSDKLKNSEKSFSFQGKENKITDNPNLNSHSKKHSLKQSKHHSNSLKLNNYSRNSRKKSKIAMQENTLMSYFFTSPSPEN